MKKYKWLYFVLALILAFGFAYFGMASSKVIDTYTKVLVAIIGFIAPTIGLLFPIFYEGVLKLETKYQQELQKKKDELKNKELQNSEIPEILVKIKSLEKEKKEYEEKLTLLDIKTQVKKLFLPLITSVVFLCGFGAFQDIQCPFDKFSFIMGSLIISIFFLEYAVYKIWVLLEVIIEAKKEIEIGKKNSQNEIKDLLKKIIAESEKQNILSDVTNQKAEALNKATADLISNSDKQNKNSSKIISHLSTLITNTETLITISDNSIPDNKLEVLIDGAKIDSENILNISIPLNVEQELNVNFVNRYDYMIQNIELGFIFATEKIEPKPKKEHYSLTTDGEKTILRYEIKPVHTLTHMNYGSILLVGKEVGVHNINVFIKGEKIKGSIRKQMIITVFDTTAKTITQGSKK